MERTGRQRAWTFAEELVHAITHGVGVLLAIAGLAVMVALAAVWRDGAAIAAVSVFGATMILTYTASTLYHALPQPRVKELFCVLDQSSIYLLIAGTYTPFAVVALGGEWVLLTIIWLLAAGGVMLTAIARERVAALTIALYLAMGWLAVVVFRPMVDALGPTGMALVVAGGVAYTVGVLFWGWRRLRYHHAIWHLFVLAGSTFHFFAVVLFVLRP